MDRRIEKNGCEVYLDINTSFSEGLITPSVLKDDNNDVEQSNFNFLQPHWPELFNMARKAEHYAYSDPQSSAVKLRCFSELIVAYLYQGFNLKLYEKSDFLSRLNNQEFKNIINKKILSKFHAIRMKGNIAVHKNRATSEDMIWLIEEAYLIACWFYKGHANGFCFICLRLQQRLFRN